MAWMSLIIVQTCKISLDPVQKQKTRKQINYTKIHSEFRDVYTGTGHFQGTFKLQVREPPILGPTEEGSIWTPEAIQRGAGQIAETTNNNNTIGHG